MGSAGGGYFGGSSSSSSSNSSKKGKKKSSEKPLKQPQRGLGVAQLEKIRLHGELGSASAAVQHHFYQNCSSYNNVVTDDMRMQTTSSFSYPTSPPPSSSSPSYAFHHNFQVRIGEYERSNNFRYGDTSQHTANAIRWDTSNTILETQHFGQPNMTRHLFNPHVEDPMQKGNYNAKSIGSSSQNSESSDTHHHQDLDLELRLSI